MIYDYQCPVCKRVEEKVNTVSDRIAKAPVCCSGKMGIVILQSPEMHIPAEVRYKCPVTNEGVTSKKQRVEIMAREGLVDANDLISSKDFRDKQEAKVKALSEESKKVPKELLNQVGGWAKQKVEKLNNR